MFRGFLFITLVTGQTLIQHKDFRTEAECLVAVRNLSQVVVDSGQSVVGVCKSLEELTSPPKDYI